MEWFVKLGVTDVLINVALYIMAFLTITVLVGRISQGFIHKIEEEATEWNSEYLLDSKSLKVLRRIDNVCCAIVEETIKSIPRLVGAFSSIVVLWVAYKLLLDPSV